MALVFCSWSKVCLVARVVASEREIVGTSTALEKDWDGRSRQPLSLLRGEGDLIMDQSMDKGAGSSSQNLHLPFVWIRSDGVGV